jgi:hypothetical protein
MTMSLLPIFVTTTQLTKKNKKKKNVKLLKAKAEHEAWLIKQGLSLDQIEARKKNSKANSSKQWYVPTHSIVDTIPSGPMPKTFVGAKPEPKVYSGERKLLGIATMHKSNMVPVFAKQDAEDISKMRRG